jgi:cytoskeletal protein RodZ
MIQSVGEKLKKARLERNISLDEAYKQTKIHSRVLEALEQDRAHTFLSFIYIKGFLKTYAQYLGLDGEKLLKEYIDSQKIEPPSTKLVLEKKEKNVVHANLFFMLRIGLVVFLILVLIFYFHYLRKNIFHTDKKVPVQKVKVKGAPAISEVVKSEVVEVEDLVLEVKTLDTCWMRVKVDNQAIFEKTLPKGRLERWQAKERIELRIGKPEALKVFFNGKAVDLKKAQVKRSLIITHEGIVGK